MESTGRRAQEIISKERTARKDTSLRDCPQKREGRKMTNVKSPKAPALITSFFQETRRKRVRIIKATRARARRIQLRIKLMAKVRESGRMICQRALEPGNPGLWKVRESSPKLMF